MHLVLEVPLQQNTQFEHAHVRRVLLHAVLACHVQLSSTLHAHLERREQQRSRQRAHDDEQRERDLEAQVLAHDVRLLLIASAGLRDRQQRETSRHAGTFSSCEFTQTR